MAFFSEFLKTIVDAIKAKTDLIPASPANEVTLAAVKAKTDNIPQYPANEISVKLRGVASATYYPAIFPDNVTGVTVSNSGVANVWGAWTQIVATIGSSHLCCYAVFITGSTATPLDIQLGSGDAGSEVVFVTTHNRLDTTIWDILIYFPNGYIAADSRLSCRIRDSLAASASYVVHVLYYRYG